MKILLINTFYNFESTGRLICGLRRYLIDHGHKVMVLYGHGDNGGDPDVIRLSSDFEGKLHNLLGRLTGLNGCFSPSATDKAIRMISSFEPDLVYLGNLHGHYINIYALYECLRELQIPTVQIMWDEYMMTGACAFAYDCERFKSECGSCPRRKDYPISWFFDTSRMLQMKKKKAYQGMKLCFVTVPYTASRARESSLLKDYRVYGVDEGVDVKTIYCPRDPAALRKKLSIRPEQKVILNVCPYPSYRKGGSYYLKLAEKCLSLPDLVFVHVGFKADSSECPANFIPIGYEASEDRLAEYYSMADLFVCTSLAETQPNTCIQALACGTPILGFDISGVPTCAHAPFGTYVPFGDISRMKAIVVRAERKSINSIQETRRYAVSRFSSEDYNRRLLVIGEHLVSNSFLPEQDLK